MLKELFSVKEYLGHNHSAFKFHRDPAVFPFFFCSKMPAVPGYELIIMFAKVVVGMQLVCMRYRHFLEGRFINRNL